MNEAEAAQIFRLNFRFSTEVLNEAAPEIETLGLEPKEFFVLDGVEERPYPAELARYLSMPRPTIALYLKNLEKKDFIARTIDPQDLRRHRLELRTAGREAVNRARAILAGKYAERIGRLNSVEQSEFAALLEKLVAE